MKKTLLLLFTVLFSICLIQAVSAQDDVDLGVKILEQVSESVAEVCWKDWCGTGFFINERNIVTNHHVVTEADFTDSTWTKSSVGERVTVYYSRANNDHVSGRVVQDWPEADLAVLEISSADSKRTPIMLVHEEAVKTGMKVFVVGFPGVLTTDLETANDPAISEGNISKQNYERIQTNLNWYKQLCYTSQTNGGNSGGPVVDRNGNVVGIHNSAIKSETQLAFFGIHVKELTDRLEKSGISFTFAPLNQAPAATETPQPTETPKPTETSVPTATPAGIQLFSGSLSNGTLIIIGAAVLALIVGTVIFILKNNQEKSNYGEAKKRESDEDTEPIMHRGYQDSPAIRINEPRIPVNEILSTESMLQDGIDNSASITGVTGQYMSVKVPLSKDKDLIVGRDPSVCNLVLDNSATLVSRKHCCIHYSRTHQRYVVRDLNSANGTVIARGSSERKVPAESAIGLKDGDLLYIPNSTNTFRVNL